MSETVQATIDRAVKIATKAALSGNPVKRVIWIPSTSATCDPRGTFAIEHCGPLSGSQTPPWDEA